MMFEHELYQQLTELGLGNWAEKIKTTLPQRNSSKFHGKYDQWQDILTQLPQVTPSTIDLDAATVRIGQPDDINPQQQATLAALLKEFHPWRKGPFDIFGIQLNTEWRSDWKWARIKDHLSPLKGKNVLDIGCGSGYHCWRMRGAGARFVVGIDPTVVFVMQFLAVQKYIQDPQVHVLPLGIEDLVEDMCTFDTVFSMGILYHRRDYQQHLQELKNCLKESGELVLETLVIDESQGKLLVPEGRYAQMRNVHAIPSVPTLTSWLQEAGFKNVRCVDVNTTTSEEQRATAWMQYQSLSDFLDPVDHRKTIEGYPAPIRAVMLATK